MTTGEASAEGAGIAVVPIGVVRNGISEPSTVWEEVDSDLVLDDECADGLVGLDEFSHAIVLFWLHLSSPWQPAPPRARGPDGSGLVGTFATRTPVRPNPIGMTVVAVLGVDGPVVRVRGLDAVDGTPVLDVKPYIHYGDRIEEPRSPEWVRDFNENKRYLDGIPVERGGRQTEGQR